MPLLIFKKKRRLGNALANYSSTISAFANKIYVSPTGNSANDGSRSSPKTLASAITAAVSGITAIIFLEGTYALNFSNGFGMGGGYLTDSGKAISFFADVAGTATITHESGQREVHCAHFTNANSKAYGLTFKLLPNASQNGTNYATSVFGTQSGSAPAYGTFYNCVFTSSGSMSLLYTSSAVTINCYNCSFVTNTPLANYTVPTNVRVYDSAYVEGFDIVSGANNNVSTFDAAYQASAYVTGVYRGDYSWGTPRIFTAYEFPDTFINLPPYQNFATGKIELYPVHFSGVTQFNVTGNVYAYDNLEYFYMHMAPLGRPGEIARSQEPMEFKANTLPQPMFTSGARTS